MSIFSKRMMSSLLRGRVSQQNESKILAIINAMNKNSNVKILFQNIQPYISADIFPGKILRISGTMKNPTIALDNGTSLGIGSILKGGYVIDAIDPKMVSTSPAQTNIYIFRCLINLLLSSPSSEGFYCADVVDMVNKVLSNKIHEKLIPK